MMGLPSPLAVAAHDSGAANLILAWLAAEGIAGVRPAMVGPAAAAWRARFGDAHSFSSPAEAMDGAAALLSGTGWASDFEHEARRTARERGITSVAVIDHWVNYRARFRRGGEEVLPDRIWVTDPHALAEARRAIPEVPAGEKPNLYLAEQVAAAGPVPQDGGALFVLEPARDDWGRSRPGEFQALDWFWANRAAAGIGPAVEIRLRPHPSDPPGKYDHWIAVHPASAADRSSDLAAAMRGARWVVGLQSAALVIAAAAGRTAISALPPWAPPCPLPQPEILRLRSR